MSSSLIMVAVATTAGGGGGEGLITSISCISVSSSSLRVRSMVMMSVAGDGGSDGFFLLRSRLVEGGGKRPMGNKRDKGCASQNRQGCHETMTFLSPRSKLLKQATRPSTPYHCTPVQTHSANPINTVKEGGIVVMQNKTLAWFARASPTLHSLLLKNEHFSSKLSLIRNDPPSHLLITVFQKPGCWGLYSLQLLFCFLAPHSQLLT